VRRGSPVAVLILASLVVSLGGLAQERRVVINEVAWGGTPADRTDEWIELANTMDRETSLEGWRLVSSDGSPDVLLSGTIPPFGFTILGRGDRALPGSARPDLVYHGALSDAGETLWLVDSEGRVVDSANQEGGSWPAGTSEWGVPPCATMERIDPSAPDRRTNWATHRPAAPSDVVCGSPGKPNSVFNVAPLAEFSFSPDPAHPGEAVLFDAGASVDPNGAIGSFSWGFGDATTAAGRVVEHRYAEPGTYSVSLAVVDDQGGSATLSRSVRVVADLPPLVDFSARSASRGSVLRNLEPLEFQDESYDPDDEIVAWTWDFGDGSLGEGRKATHLYARAGTYTVTLLVTARAGEVGSQAQLLRLETQPPVARFDVSPQTPSEQVEAFFDASLSSDPDGAIVRYEWDFDADGEIDHSTAQTGATHVFDDGGRRVVSLRAIDDQGAVSPPFSLALYVNRRPVTAFQVSNLFPWELEEVRFTDRSQDPEGSIASWLWSFGDGTTSPQSSASHSYAEEGTCSVVLTVKDGYGAEGRASATITVQNLPPLAILRANGKLDLAQASTEETVTLEATESRDPSPRGRIVRYEWDVAGTGSYAESTTTPVFTYRFPDDGTYRARVRVTDNDGATALSEPVTIQVANRAPTAAFAWSPSSPSDADEVVLTPAAFDPDGTIVAWRWRFGDGTAATVERPAHRFGDDGTYDVTLIVRDDDGSEGTLTLRVTVGNAPPVAAFDLVTASPRVGEAVTVADRSYDPSPTGHIVHVAWDFGDGTTCPGPVGACAGEGVESHVYQVPGTYTIVLIVIDEEGALSRTTRAITVVP